MGMVFELGSSSSVSEAAYTRAAEELGVDGVLELSVLVGYYTMLSYTWALSTYAACSSGSSPVCKAAGVIGVSPVRFDILRP